MIDEAIRCACGLEMVPITAGSSIKMCPNCDTCQDVERTELPDGKGFGERVKSTHDHRFELAWKRKIRVEFTGKAAA